MNIIRYGDGRAFLFLLFLSCYDNTPIILYFSYNLLTFKVGGKDWINFLALPASLITKVYKEEEPLTLNLVCLNGLPALFNFLLILTVAVLTSALLVNSKNCLMSVISLAIFL